MERTLLTVSNGAVTRESEIRQLDVLPAISKSMASTGPIGTAQSRETFAACPIGIAIRPEDGDVIELVGVKMGFFAKS